MGLIKLVPEESSHKYQHKKTTQTKLFKAVREATRSLCRDAVARAVGLKETEYFLISFSNFIPGLSLSLWGWCVSLICAFQNMVILHSLWPEAANLRQQ